MLKVYSVFSSIQGEASCAGLPCTFVRLAGCPLACSYCDTRYACESEGREAHVREIVESVGKFRPKLVEVTGGEPLFQEETPELLRALCDAGFQVLLETCGAFPVDHIDPRVRVILDVKCPSSGMADRMLYDSLERLSGDRHEVKFVVGSRTDFEWAVDLCRMNDLHTKVEVFVSPVDGEVQLADLADWVVSADIPLKLQIQLHKVIWPKDDEER